MWIQNFFFIWLCKVREKKQENCISGKQIVLLWNQLLRILQTKCHIVFSLPISCKKETQSEKL